MQLSRPPGQGRSKLRLLAQNLIQELAHSSLGFEYGVTVVHSARQVGVCECDTPERPATEDFTRSRLAIASEEESRVVGLDRHAPTGSR